MQSSWLDDRRHLWLSLLPILIVLCLIAYQRFIAQSDVPAFDPCLGIAASCPFVCDPATGQYHLIAGNGGYVIKSDGGSFVAAEYRARYIWLTSGFIALVAAIGAVVFSFSALRRLLNRRQFREAAAIIAVVVVGAILFLLWRGDGFNNRATQAMFRSLFAAIPLGGDPSLSLYDFLGRWHLPFEQVVIVTTGITLVLACCATTRNDPRFPDGVSGRGPAFDLALSIDLLRQLVYVGSGTLAMAIVALQTYVRMPVDLLAAVLPNLADKQPAPAIAVANDIGAGLLIYWSVGLSVGIIATYAICAGILAQRARRLGEQRTEIKTLPELRKWLQDNGLDFDFASIVKQIVAGMTPLLAGSFGSLTSLITG